MNPIVYIGKNQNYITHFLSNLDDKMVVTDNTEEALSIIALYPKVKTVIVLYEGVSTEDDFMHISGLKAAFDNIYIVLVTEPLNAGEGRCYIKAGANNTVSPYADKETLDTISDFVRKNEDIESGKHLMNESEFKTFRFPCTKRAFDIIVSFLALVLLSPLLLVVAILIRIESEGPIIYKSRRVGSNYFIFDFLKFRSMYIDADKKLDEYKSLDKYNPEDPRVEDEEVIKYDVQAINDDDPILISDDFQISEHEYVSLKKKKEEKAFTKLINDPRVTKMGRFMRKYSIDELPQLINILKGDMSIVGNRPLPLYEAELLTNDDYIGRFIAPAGLTGLWQVEKRGESGSMSPEERKQLDIYYAKNYSISLDLKIIFKTFSAFIQRENV